MKNLWVTLYMTVMPSKSWSRRIYETVGANLVRYTNIIYKVIETSFTLFSLQFEPKTDCYALERLNDYGTEN
jgi:hypothetical protein